MIVTHEEAQTKWCCAYNQMCVGNQCMAWKPHLVPLPQGEGWRPVFPPTLIKLVDSGKGYCGLVRHG